MVREIAWVLALVVTCGPVAAAGGQAGAPQGRPEKVQALPRDGRDRPPGGPNRSDDRWKWWLYDRVELGITDQQSAAINQIFEATIPKLRESRQEMERAEDELSRTIKEHKADLATISMLVDRAESARSQNTKMRILMLYRMHLLLSAEQRVKLEAVRARWDAARKDKDKEPPAGHRRRP